MASLSLHEPLQDDAISSGFYGLYVGLLLTLCALEFGQSTVSLVENLVLERYVVLGPAFL